MYANDEHDELTLPIRANMTLNARWQFVLVYTEPATAKATAIDDVAAAVAAHAIRVGGEAGLPLHHYGLGDVAGAHRAVQEGAIGKVLIDVQTDGG
jgi:NADPH2:quinone reductase